MIDLPGLTVGTHLGQDIVKDWSIGLLDYGIQTTVSAREIDIN